MKKLFFISVTLSFALFSGCTSGKGSTLRYDPKFDSMECSSGQLAVPLKGRKANPMSRTGQHYKIRGMVEVNERGSVYIVEKWEYRSRKSYLVTGEFTERIATLKGKVVSVRCCFLQRKRWSGTVRVLEILD